MSRQENFIELDWTSNHSLGSRSLAWLFCNALPAMFRGFRVDRSAL